MSSIRYVDADNLTRLASQAGWTRDDLQEALSLAAGRVNATPHRGWDQSAWWDARNTLQSEFSLLNDDRSALLSRAERVRTVAAERALMAWLEELFGPAADTVASMSQEERTNLIAMLFSALKYGVPVLAALGIATLNDGKVIVSGSHLLRYLSGFGAATRMNPSTAFSKLLTSPKGFALLTVVRHGVQNWVRYGEESLGKVVTATTVDSLITFGITWGIKAAAVGLTVAGLAALGITAPAWVVPAVGVGALVVGSVAASWVLGKVQETSQYKAFINDPVKAVGDAFAGAQTFVTSAGKKIDAALDATVQSVAEPINKVSKWFGSIDPVKNLKQSFSW